MTPQLVVAVLVLVPGAASAQTPGWDQGRSVYERRVRPAESPEKVEWDARVTALLSEEPGDLVVAAVGDLIFNERISHLSAPERKNLLRILQEADVAIGNLEFSIKDRPELQRVFYNFRAPRAFAWELAAAGISLVSLANSHALDFGPEGLLECLRALDLSGIAHAGAVRTLAEAREAGTKRPPGQKGRVALLSYMRYWTDRDRCADPSGPCLATIDPATVLVARPDGTVEAVEGPQERDVLAMEEDVLLARRRHGPVFVSYHVHDVSHARAYGIQETTPPNEEIPFRRAIDDEGPLFGVPRLAPTKRPKEIVAVLQRISAPYGTKIALREWYGEAELPTEGAAATTPPQQAPASRGARSGGPPR